jgi:hypothetical protein
LSKSKTFKLSGISLPYPPPTIDILCVSSDVQVRVCVGPVPLVEAEPLAKEDSDLFSNSARVCGMRSGLVLK